MRTEDEGKGTGRSLARLTALAVRQHMSLGVLASSSPSDFALVLAAAGNGFAPGEIWSERQVNERLESFLRGAGAMLSVDHVELRRWLVDNRVLERDGFGRAYARGAPREEIAHVLADLSGHDLAAIVLDARRRDADARAARKQKWQNAQDAA